MQFDSPLSAFLHWERTTPNNIIFRQPIDGRLIDYNYFKAGQEIRRIAMALKQLNLQEKSKVAILSKENIL